MGDADAEDPVLDIHSLTNNRKNTHSCTTVPPMEGLSSDCSKTCLYYSLLTSLEK